MSQSSWSSNLKFGAMLAALVALTYFARSINNDEYQLLKPASQSQSQPSRRVLSSYSLSDYCENTDQNNTFSESALNQSANIFAFVSGSRAGTVTNITEILQGKNSDYLSWLLSYIYYSLSWLILIIFTLIMCTSCCICCCCRDCKCCQRCRCKSCWCCFPSETKKYMKCESVFLSLVALGIIGASITGFIYIQQLGEGFNGTACSALKALQTFNNGSDSYNWTGFTPLRTKLYSLVPLIYDAAQYTGIGFQSDTDLQTANTSFYSQLGTFYTSWSTLQVKSPAPPASGSIVPDMINNWGPQSSLSTSTGRITAEIVGRADMVSASNTNIQKAAYNIGNITNSIATNASDTAESIGSLSSSVESTYNTITNTLDYISPQAFRMGGFVIFGITCLVSLLALLAIVVGLKCKVIFTMHFTWVVMLMITFICLLFATICFLTTALTVEACDFLTYLRGGSQNADTLSWIRETPWINNFKGCLYAQTPMSLESTLNISTNLPDLVTYVNGLSNLSSYISFTYPQSAAISALRSEISSYIQGTKPCYTRTSDDSNPSVALSVLNKWTNYQTESSLQLSVGNCKITTDEWKFNKVNCSVTSSTSYTSSIGTNVCFSVMDASLSNVQSRYSSALFAACNKDSSGNSIHVDMENYYSSTKAHIDDVITKFTSLDDAFANFLLTAVDPVNLEVNKIIHPIKTLQTNTYSLIDAFNNSESGILTNLQCNFIQNLTTDFQNNFCVGFVVPVFYVAAAFGGLSIFALFGSIFAFLLARKLLVPDESKAFDYSQDSMSKEFMNKSEIDTRL